MIMKKTIQKFSVFSKQAAELVCLLVIICTPILTAVSMNILVSPQTALAEDCSKYSVPSAVDACEAKKTSSGRIDSMLKFMADNECGTTATSDTGSRALEVCRDRVKTDQKNIDLAKDIDELCKPKLSDLNAWLNCASSGIKNTNSGAPNPTDTPTAVKSDCSGSDLNESNCGIVKYLKIAINTLSALAGVVIIGSVIVGGIQYSTSADDPQAVAKAKGRIINALIALLLFMFGYGILVWLIPGGLL